MVFKAKCSASETPRGRRGSKDFRRLGCLLLGWNHYDPVGTCEIANMGEFLQFSMVNMRFCMGINRLLLECGSPERHENGTCVAPHRGRSHIRVYVYAYVYAYIWS